MPSRDLIEKVAQEIRARRDGAGCTPWSRLNEAHKMPYRRDAEAALSVVLAELQNVTPEMMRVGVDYRLGTVIDGGNNWKTDTCTLFCRMLSVSPLMKDEAS